MDIMNSFEVGFTLNLNVRAVFRIFSERRMMNEDATRVLITVIKSELESDKKLQEIINRHADPYEKEPVAEGKMALLFIDHEIFGCRHPDFLNIIDGLRALGIGVS